MGKNNMIVARIQQHTSASIGKSERHNERKNLTHENLNVDPERIGMNVHFKDPCRKSYFDIFKEKEDAGKISTRGLRADATLFDEMIIDVNTMYFEQHGGYEFAKEFYEEVFHFAEKIYGSSNIVSAVMHADEINIAATEACGHPVYHYHIHIIAIPVVEKKVLFSKRCKDENLSGTVKEVINQVSHSKKWESRKQEVDEYGQPVLGSNGKPKFIKSYSLLQDQLFEHMRDAGFADFNRGVRGSTAEHLSSLQCQYKKDMERKEALEVKIQDLAVDYTPAHEIFRTYMELDKTIAKKSLTGKVVMTQKDAETLTALAKEGISSRGEIGRLNDQIVSLRSRYSRLYDAYDRLEEKYEALQEKCRTYLEALRRFPEKVKDFITSLLAIPEIKETEKKMDSKDAVPTVKVRKKKSTDRER